jgi:tetratricopeptide (TPR) repeat protein
MPVRNSSSAILLSILLSSATAAWSQAHQPPEKLGEVSFATSCDPSVRPQFERAVALLHSFWFPQGEKAFREVLERDPTCAIAAWGVASIRIGNTFAGTATAEDAEQARQIIERGRAIGFKTERERFYLEAVAEYWNGFAARAHGARMQSLANAFEKVAGKFPGDDEAQIFYGIYLTATQAPTEKTFAAALKSAGILEAQFAKHPSHPGVAHYLIHSYDFPPIAEKGLNAARRYASIAPSAPHAQHMPSHIFTRVGAWQDSITTNQRSVDAALKENDAGSAMHAWDYMAYAQLQLARDDDTRKLIQTQSEFKAPGVVFGYARAAIPARYALERGMWKEAAAVETVQTPLPFVNAMRNFTRALGAARSGNPAAAEGDLLALDKSIEALKSAKNAYWAIEVEVQRAAAGAWVALAKGAKDEALRAMRAAVDLEDSSEKHAVSPGRLLPARELLGEMLLEAGRPGDALAEFERSLVRDPNRFRSYSGAGLAAAQAGNAEKARYYYGRLVDMAGAGVARPETARARAYLASK